MKPDTSRTGRVRTRPGFNGVGTAGKISLKNALAYPAEFFAPILSFLIFVFVFSRLYTAAVPEGGAIEGYTRQMLIYYFMIAELCVFGFGNLFSQISEEVKSGQFAYSLTRPFDFIRYHAAVLLAPAAAQCAVLAAVGTAFCVIAAGLPSQIAPVQAAMVPISLALSAVLNFLLQTAISFTAFWFEENSAFYWIYQKFALIIGTLIPVEFLPPALERIARLTPFPYLGYAPARIAVAFDIHESLGLLASQLVWIGIGLVLCRAIFVLGRRSVAANGG